MYIVGNNWNSFTIKRGKDKKTTSIKKIVNKMIDIFFNADCKSNLSDNKKDKLNKVKIIQ